MFIRFEYCADATENDIDKADGIDTKVNNAEILFSNYFLFGFNVY